MLMEVVFVFHLMMGCIPFCGRMKCCANSSLSSLCLYLFFLFSPLTATISHQHAFILVYICDFFFFHLPAYHFFQLSYFSNLILVILICFNFVFFLRPVLFGWSCASFLCVLKDWVVLIHKFIYNLGFFFTTTFCCLAFTWIVTSRWPFFVHFLYLVVGPADVQHDYYNLFR